MTLHRGKLARPPTILNVRALTRDDLMVLRADRGETERAGGTIIQRFRDPHHRVARLVAAGLRNGEIAERSGMSYNRVSALRGSPAFEELVAKYRGKVNEAFEREQDEYAKLATGNMLKAERMISEKLEEHDENGTLPPVRELIAISRDAADRFGYGKRQTNLNVNADFAAMLEAARGRSTKAKDITPINEVGKVVVQPAIPMEHTKIASTSLVHIEATVVPPEQPSLQSQPMKVVPAASSAGHPSLPLIRRRA